MGIEHRITGEAVELLVRGSFTVDELLAGFHRMLADTQLPLSARLLIDVTESGELPPLSVIERISALLLAGRTKLAPRLAVLVAQTVRYGRARQLGALLESGGFMVLPFYDRTEAHAWLRAQDE